MFYQRLFLLLFCIGNSKLFKHGKQGFNHERIKKPSIRYFFPKNINVRDETEKTGYNASEIQRILNLDDLENNNGEVYSSEDNSGIENYGYRRVDRTRVEMKRMFHSSESTSGITSTSVDTHEFKEEWVKRWNELKQDAVHKRKPGQRQIVGDVVNMVAARPWYQPCGDPAQHDVPWGTCTLDAECDGEYRIYRGDPFCGRSQLVCCAIEAFRYDLNQAFDVSFAVSSAFSTSSEEALREARGSKENRQRKRKRKKKKLEGIKHRRKRSIKKMIRKLMKQVRKELNRAFRNNTRKRRLAITNVKILINAMKKKYKVNRQAARELHSGDWMQITGTLLAKLRNIRLVNQYFLTNDTFREMVVNGTMKKSLGRELLARFPELIQFPEMKELNETANATVNKTRRSGSEKKGFGKPLILQVTMPLKHKNNKENLPSIFKKPLYINTGLKIHPKLLQVRRQIPIQAATRKEYRKAAPLINISDKGKDILSNLIFRIQGKDSPRPSARRSFKRNRRRYSSVEDTSSSEEMAAWKVGYDEDWLRLKKEAILVKKNNSHHGDAIFMMAARPWTSPCGDPQQHDWVWGTCTLSTQCAAEYRIYRGDVYCGRSPLVCCAVQYTAHDLYQGLDRSFEYTDSSSSTEKKKNNIDTVGLRQKKKYRERVRRWRRKRRIKRVIKRKIRSLVHELRKTLNRAFRNASNDRSRKVEALIAQIKSNKYKFRHERNVAKKNFETVADNIHASLYNKLIQLQSVNAHFFLNETFREYLKRFNITGSYLRLLHSVNPKLLAYLSEKPKLAERLGQMLSESPIKSSIDLPNETNQAIQPLTTLKVKDMKKILRQSDPISYDIGEIQNLSSIQDSNLLSNASLEVENTPPAEAVVTESITPFQNSTPLAEMNTDEPNYNDMEKTTPKDVNYDTRRFGSFIFERQKHKKKPKRKDYVEYDIEYGILNL